MVLDSNWEKELLETAKRRDEAEEQRFLELVDLAQDRCTLDVARVLMKTFSDQPDYGTQERVVSILGTAAYDDMVIALLDELPRLIVEAPEWAESLIGVEVHFRPNQLEAAAARMPEHIRSALRRTLANRDFQGFYPNASKIKI